MQITVPQPQCLNFTTKLSHTLLNNRCMCHLTLGWLRGLEVSHMSFLFECKQLPVPHQSDISHGEGGRAGGWENRKWPMQIVWRRDDWHGQAAVTCTWLVYAMTFKGAIFYLFSRLYFSSQTSALYDAALKKTHSFGLLKYIFSPLFVDLRDKPAHFVTSQRADFLHCVFCTLENGSSSINKRWIFFLFLSSTQTETYCLITLLKWIIHKMGPLSHRGPLFCSWQTLYLVKLWNNCLISAHLVRRNMNS